MHDLYFVYSLISLSSIGKQMNLTEYSQSIMGLHNVRVYLFVHLYMSMCVFPTSLPHDLISCDFLINLSI